MPESHDALGQSAETAANKLANLAPNKPVEVDVCDQKTLVSTEHDNVPYVVAIGASAGGLQPLEQFFHHMPAGSGVAFVVIQHLSPDFKSLMKELLSRHTRMNVHRVEDDMVIEPDSIYLIPPRKFMSIKNGHLMLRDQDLSGQRLNFPIDEFFESVANDRGDRAVGIVLSGTGSDGTRGIRSISESGGLVMVQDPQTAEFDGMPLSAISTGLAHFVQSPDQLARSVFDYVKRIDDAAAKRLPVHPELLEAGCLAEIHTILRTTDGLDFSHYKSSTVARRISRRMLITHHDRVQDYLHTLATNEEECEALRNDLLIGVTSFFRDPDAWISLSNHVIPRLVREADKRLRVWITACSTGEEVYTLAILLREEIERQNKSIELKIFATDIDKGALEHASIGQYPANISNDLGEKRLARHFKQIGAEFAVNRELRELIIFSPHNLIRDAPFTKMDLVTCRNVLIYMQPELQKRVLAMLHFSLRAHGVLFLGAAESVLELDSEFKVLDKRWKQYEKKRDVLLPVDRLSALPARIEPIYQRSIPKPQISRQTDRILADAYRMLLDQLSGLCLVLNEHMEVLHVFGQRELFLQIPEGAGTKDVTRMLPQELVLPLRTAAHQTRQNGKPVSYTDLQIATSQQLSRIDMFVRQSGKREDEPPFFLVLLRAAQKDRGDETQPFDVKLAATERIAELERELQHTRENLQATIEELATANEEQQASNEELIASNEELQSTNEELHSVNEELFTVNSEYQQKIQELTELNDDMNNLLHSTQIGTIFLDENLLIRRFTNSVAPVVPITDADIGRPLSDLASTLDVRDLTGDLRRVLESAEPLERLARTTTHEIMLMRVLPYRSKSDKPTGLVVTFIDITELRQVEEQVRLRDAAVQSLSIGVLITDASRSDLPIIYVNPAFSTLTGYAADEVLGRNCRFLQGKDTDERTVQRIRDAIKARKQFHDIILNYRKDGTPFWNRLLIQPVVDEQNKITHFIGLQEDVTEQNLHQYELKRINSELLQKHREMEEFVYTVSHDLKSPLVTVSGMVGYLKQQLKQGKTDRVDELMITVEETAIRMREKIDNLLEISRIGRSTKPHEPVPMDEVVIEVIHGLQTKIESQGIKVDIQPNLPTVTGDRNQLERLIENLATNAIKYGSTHDAPQITIGSEQTSDHMRLFVQDNGGGIPSEFHEKIFGLFNRLESDKEGTGVGLALVRRVMDVHHGKTWVESEPGEGCTFWLEFQVEPAQDELQPTMG